MSNNHFVPKLVLRRFSDQICTYNVKTGELKENIKLDNAYAIKNLYDDVTENALNREIESQFGNVLSNVIFKSDKIIKLSRPQLYIVKKFLLIELLRTHRGESFMQMEKNHYDRKKEFAIQHSKTSNEPFNEALFDMLFKPPFVEKHIPGESSHEYWMRTLRCVLETDGTPEGMLKHPDITYPAYRWARILQDGYLAFWDTPKGKNEFVITDIGMTSENEKGWVEIINPNHKKKDYVSTFLTRDCSKNEYNSIMTNITTDFVENFYMFSISKTRMIALISPFFRFRAEKALMGKPIPPLDTITCISNEKLFFPNSVEYVNSQNNGLSYHSDDRYVYEIKKLSKKELLYCNALLLDRIDTYLGFSSLNNAVQSIACYKKLNAPPFRPRVDYTPLYKIIEERYKSSINY